MLKLYENIKQNRIAKGWSQAELARRVGYSDKSMISKIEKGSIDLSQTQIKKFADAFDISMSELFGTVEETLMELKQKMSPNAKNIVYKDGRGKEWAIMTANGGTGKTHLAQIILQEHDAVAKDGTEDGLLIEQPIITDDEKHLLDLYRAGRFKDIVNLMMDKI
jgi:transcriptional regulator with XRE-family HTH domain